MPDLALLILVLLPFAGSAAALLLPSRRAGAAVWVAVVASLAALIVTASFYEAVSTGALPRLQRAWMPTAGLDFSVRMDGLAWMFCCW